MAWFEEGGEGSVFASTLPLVDRLRTQMSTAPPKPALARPDTEEDD
jgi:hypothetical protein